MAVGMIHVDSQIAEEMQEVIDKCQITTLSAQKQVVQALVMAEGVSRLRSLITKEAMKPLMDLQGTSLGFRTDKDKSGGYPEDVVKEVFIEATLRGFRMIGNEVNIIAGRFYGTKEGFSRLVGSFEGLTDLKLQPGVPKTSSGGAIVPFKASWKLHGKPQELEREIPCKGDSYSGVDQYIGKATRKMLASIYGILTGSEHSVPDGDAGDTLERPRRLSSDASTEARIESLEDTTKPQGKTSGRKRLLTPDEEAQLKAEEAAHNATMN